MFQAITTLDTFIQKGVDHAVFAVMRGLNVRRSSIRFALLVTAATSILIDTAVRHDFIGAIGGLIVAGAATFARVPESMADGAAAPLARPMNLVRGLFKIVLAAYVPIRLVVTYEYFQALSDVALLLWLYVGDTPGVPPPKEKRETVMSAVGEGA